jgi:hypothetical protein
MEIKIVTGRVTFLRVHEFGSGWGAPNDNLNDAEVIVRLDDDPRTYGLGLRLGEKLPAAQAMFALLQDAYNTDTPVTVEYEERPGSNNHYLFRVVRKR